MRMKAWEEKLIEEIEECICNTTPDKFLIKGRASVPLYEIGTIMDAILEVFKEENEND